MQISIFKLLFYYLFHQFQATDSFEYEKMEMHHLNTDLYQTFNVEEHGLF